MSKQHEIIIIGGGLVGASLALALAKQGKDVALLERKPPRLDLAPTDPDWDARIYAISPANRAWLQMLGAWPDERRVQPVRQMDVAGDEGGRIVFDTPPNQERLTSIVENRWLLMALWQQLRLLNVAIYQQVAVAHQSDISGAHLQLADGTRLTAKLIVGADGAQSWLRATAGIKVVAEAYHHHGVVACFAIEKPHHGVAYQWFFEGQVLAYLPLPNQQMSMVWSTPHPEALTQLSPQELGEKVARAGHQQLGALTPTTPAYAFELILRRPKQTIGQRLVLVGDAAHTIHPLAGQGVNLGFGDVMCLAELLISAPDAGAQSLLRQYQRLRLNPVRTMQAGCDGLFRLFASQDAAIQALRNLGLNGVNAAKPLKKRLIAQAMGWQD